MSRTTAVDVQAIARQTWLMLHNMCRDKNAPHTRWSERDGYTLKLPGPLGMTIRFASARATGSSRHGEKVTWDVISHLRRYGNVAALGGRKVFVALTYNDVQPIIERDRYRSVSKQEQDIIEREAGPVTTTNLWEEFSKAPIGPRCAEALKIIHQHGGSIVDEDGFTSTSKGISAAGLKSARDRKLVVTRQANARRYAAVALTTRGRWAVEHLSMIQYADVAVAAFLARRGGSYTGSTPKRTTTEIADELRTSYKSVGRALQLLEEQGVVERVWSPGHVNDESGGCVASARLTGKPIPGVHLEPMVPLVREDEPTEDGPEGEPWSSENLKATLDNDVVPLDPEPEIQWDDEAIARSNIESDKDEPFDRTPSDESPPVPPISTSVEAAAEYLAKVARDEARWENNSRLTKIKSVIAACNAGTVTPMKALSTIEELLE